MANLSVTSAFGAGFRLIGRAPLTPLIWGLVGFLITSPVQIYQVVRLPGIIQTMRNSTDLAAWGPLLAEFGGLILLAIPLSLIAGAVISAACVRAVLHPDQARRFYLRFGRAELSLMPILIALWFFYLLFFIGGGFGLVGMIQVGSSWAGGLGAFLGVVAGIAFWQLLALAFLRFAFAPPMTVRDSRPRLAASWGATRGIALKLLGLLWLMVLFAMVVAFGFGLVGGIVGVAVMLGSGGLNPQTSAELSSSPLGLGLNMAMGALLGGYFFVLILAPFVDAYRQTHGVQGLEEVF